VAFVLMVIFMLTAKPRYASTAVMIVPQGNPAASSLEAQLSFARLDLLGGGFELYADILKSRSVADVLIENRHLMTVYRAPNLETAEAILGSLTKVEASREGMIRVTVQDSSPQRAADLANDYLHQLDLLNSSLVLTNIGQQRAFLEREMVKEKNALADAEVALKQVQESTTGLPPEAAASADLTALETTRAELRADQIRLGALLTGETEANPEVIRLRTQIAGLSSQLERLQSGSASTVTGVPTSQVPAQTLEYTRRLRDVKFHESLFTLLEKDFETAKEQEAKTPSIVQVLDPAVPARHKAWPPRTLYCLMAGVVGTILGIFLVSLRAFFRSFSRAPQNQPQIRELREILRPWRRSA
ncbi:MAG: hypothetical protein M3N54_12125, partial [Acidobacteriota bacterium]|nr:hypothetical protein [Acidobacteriota bacterium]